RDHHRDEERGEPARATLEQRPRLVLERREPALPRAEHDAHPVPLALAQRLALEPRVPDRLARRDERVLRERIEPVRQLALHVVERVEALQLARERRRERRWVEARDRGRAAPPLEQRRPE